MNVRSDIILRWNGVAEKESDDDRHAVFQYLLSSDVGLDDFRLQSRVLVVQPCDRWRISLFLDKL
jgi:hypothetical protein